MSYLDDQASQIKALVAPELVPPGADPLFRLYAVLLRAKGEAVTASDVHDAWAAWTQDQDPGHESLKPFDQLPAAVAVQDEPFVEAIRTAARYDLGRGPS